MTDTIIFILTLLAPLTVAMTGLLVVAIVVRGKWW